MKHPDFKSIKHAADAEVAAPFKVDVEFRVLFVDDDPDCLVEYVEMGEALGYSCCTAESAPAALRAMAADPSIGIVVTDVEMPTMDGISLLDEINVRFSQARPVVAIVVTGYGSLGRAVSAMRASATDFLSKPVSRDDLAAALRRSSLRWAQLVSQMRLASVRKAASQEGGASDQPRDMSAVVRSILKSRQRRAEFIGPNLFSDPAWDILLDLTSARLDGKVVPVSSVCAAAAVPMSTALRHIRQLVDSGMVRRWQDPSDKRRDLLELQPDVMAAMIDYLETVTRKDSGNLPI